MKYKFYRVIEVNIIYICNRICIMFVLNVQLMYDKNKFKIKQVYSFWFFQYRKIIKDILIICMYMYKNS